MIENGIIKDESIYGVPFRIDLIPVSNESSRPGTKILATSKTIHNTGNNDREADADMHTEYVDNTTRYVSWHFTVDDQEIIQELPIDEMAYHAGTTRGNQTSIGIEICEHKGIDWEKAKKNAALLCVYLENEANINGTCTHQSWSGKYCPHRIIYEGWNKFLDLIEKTRNEVENMQVSEWAKDAWEWSKENGINDGKGPKKEITEEQCMVFLKRYHDLYHI